MIFVHEFIYYFIEGFAHATRLLDKIIIVRLICQFQCEWLSWTIQYTPAIRIFFYLVEQVKCEKHDFHMKHFNSIWSEKIAFWIERQTLSVFAHIYAPELSLSLSLHPQTQTHTYRSIVFVCKLLNFQFSIEISQNSHQFELQFCTMCTHRCANTVIICHSFLLVI